MTAASSTSSSLPWACDWQEHNGLAGQSAIVFDATGVLDVRVLRVWRHSMHT